MLQVPLVSQLIELVLVLIAEKVNESFVKKSVALVRGPRLLTKPRTIFVPVRIQISTWIPTFGFDSSTTF